MFVQRIQEKGNRYGRLEVIEHAETGRDGHARWLCRCDCGEGCIRSGSDLRRGIVQSCGCLQIEAATATIQNVNLMRGSAPVHDSYGRLLPGVKIQPLR